VHASIEKPDVPGQRTSSLGSSMMAFLPCVLLSGPAIDGHMLAFLEIHQTLAGLLILYILTYRLRGWRRRSACRRPDAGADRIHQSGRLYSAVGALGFVQSACGALVSGNVTRPSSLWLAGHLTSSYAGPHGLISARPTPTGDPSGLPYSLGGASAASHHLCPQLRCAQPGSQRSAQRPDHANSLGPVFTFHLSLAHRRRP